VDSFGSRERQAHGVHLIGTRPILTSALAAADLALADRIAHRDAAAFEQLMRQHNGRLFRVVRAILRDDAEAEDALQDAYIDAYRHISEFRGTAQLGTWLTRIAVNHALMRLRKSRRERQVIPMHESETDGVAEAESVPDPAAESPVTTTLRAEMRELLERRIDELPVAFRTVFVMREVEEMTVDETAAALAIPPATVRTRLFRARALLRNALANDVDVATRDVFGFAGSRCDRIVAAVLARTTGRPPLNR
jgi:RNA polymerase sigma-70 factor (ECF subfamily)